MRFFVEVTMIGKTSSQVYCVAAGSWQPALEATRALRGEPKSLVGFSIELVDDGCRAVDPAARWRFVVRKAPDDAPLTPTSTDKLEGTAGKAPEEKAKSALPPRAEDKSSKSVTPAKSTSKATGKSESKSPPKVAPKSEAKGEAKAEAKGEAKAEAKGEAKAEAKVERKSLPPRPGTPEAQKESVPKTKSSIPPKNRAIVYNESGAVAVRTAVPPEPRTIPNLPPPSSGTELAPSIPLTTLFERDQPPGSASPIHYHEGVYAVAEGTSEADAERLLRERLHAFQTKLANAKPVNYINLAIFDRVFEGKPPVLPLVTMSFRDWKGVDPEVAYPRRAKAAAVAPTRMSMTDAARAANKPDAAARPAATGPGAPSPDVPAGIAAIAEALAKVSAPPPPPDSTNDVAIPLEQRVAPPPAPVPSFDAPVSPAVAPPADATIPTLSDFDKPSGPDLATPLVRTVSQPPQGQVAAPPIAIESPAPVAIAVDFTPPPPTVVDPPVAADAPASVSAPPPSGRSRRRLTPHDPFPVAAAGRTGAEELLPSLFERVHDLHFLEDSIDGAYFVLRVANEQIPCRAAMVHFFDMTKREYVLVSAIGSGTRALLLQRHPETDALLSAAARKKGPNTVNDAETNDSAFIERYERIGGAKRVLVVPIAHFGRTLGMIELVNPIDGLPFEEVEAHAISYLAGQLGEFFGSRGLVIEAQRINAAADRNGAA